METVFRIRIRMIRIDLLSCIEIRIEKADPDPAARK
jgi:hypothetical protein